jgi:hypothetical protein
VPRIVGRPGQRLVGEHPPQRLLGEHRVVVGEQQGRAGILRGLEHAAGIAAGSAQVRLADQLDHRMLAAQAGEGRQLRERPALIDHEHPAHDPHAREALRLRDGVALPQPGGHDHRDRGQIGIDVDSPGDRVRRPLDPEPVRAVSAQGQRQLRHARGDTAASARACAPDLGGTALDPERHGRLAQHRAPYGGGQGLAPQPGIGVRGPCAEDQRLRCRRARRRGGGRCGGGGRSGGGFGRVRGPSVPGAREATVRGAAHHHASTCLPSDVLPAATRAAGTSVCTRAACDAGPPRGSRSSDYNKVNHR